MGGGGNLSPTLYGIKHAGMSLIIAMAFRTGTLLSSQSCSVKFKHFFSAKRSSNFFCLLSQRPESLDNLDSQVTTT